MKHVQGVCKMKIEVTFKQELDCCGNCRFIQFKRDWSPVCAIDYKAIERIFVNREIPDWCPGRYENRED